MVSENIIKRYAWVINLLISRGKATLVQINEAWLRSYLAENDRETFSRITWYRAFDEIHNIFGIHIKVDRTHHRYDWYIANPEVITNNAIDKWMLSSLQYQNMIRDCLKVYDRVLLEDFPSEGGLLSPIIDAIKSNLKIKLQYRKYGEQGYSQRTLCPYAIKTYKHRFYVLARERKKLKIFAFDRIYDLQLTNEHFRLPANWSAHVFFYHIYGVMLPKETDKPERVTIKAYYDAPYYLRDVPLHHTQQEGVSTDDYTIFKYDLYISKDFIGDIIQQQYRLEVISPQWLRDEVQSILKKTLNLYSENTP